MSTQSSGSIPPLNIAFLLKQYGIRPDKSLGQNFLQDPAALQTITQVAEIEPTDTVLEIGPGLGGLTRYLASFARQVVAVELDKRLIPPLQAVLSGFTNTSIVHGDILDLSPTELVNTPDYLVVANIPYYITSALLRHLLETAPRPRRLVLTVQKEVAERICARPGGMSLLSLSVQVYGQPVIAAHILAGAFYPVPKVDSAVVKIEIHPEPVIPAPALETFFHLAKSGFSQKRKTLRNALSAGLHISPARAENILHAGGIDPQRRAETLSLVEWGKLTEEYKP